MDVPKSPVSRGNNGSFITIKFKVRIPSIPEVTNNTKESSLLPCCSLSIKNPEAKISKKGINFSKYLYICGSIKTKTGVRRRTKIIPKYPPIVANLTASYPLPSNNKLCPGRIDNAVDSSGAPRNIEGIKSRKECVIDMDTIKTAKTIGKVCVKRAPE